MNNLSQILIYLTQYSYFSPIFRCLKGFLLQKEIEILAATGEYLFDDFDLATIVRNLRQLKTEMNSVKCKLKISGNAVFKYDVIDFDKL